MSTWLKVAKERSDYPPLALHEEFIAASLNHPKEESLEVFISYSRADSDFARKLNDALQELGKTTWFDQESIAVGVDFQQEIKRGIESCDNFVFVISPRSVNSDYCGEEVEYAQKLNKRLIPILHTEVSPEELHPALGKIQWIDFKRHGGDFSINFNELVRTLDTDRDYVRSHSKWYQRAREWEQKDKSGDLLLRGSQLTIAENWLQDAQQNQKQPPATSLQKGFIDASVAWRERILQREKRQNMVLRLLLAGVGTAFVVAVCTSVYAFQQKTIANFDKRFAQATLEAFKKPIDGLVKAIKLADKSENELNKVLDSVRNTLFELLKMPVESNIFKGHKKNVTSVAFSPNGKYIASGSEDETLRLWDLDGNLVSKPFQGHNPLLSDSENFYHF